MTLPTFQNLNIEEEEDEEKEKSSYNRNLKQIKKNSTILSSFYPSLLLRLLLVFKN
jgi:hypothetical protein